MPGAQKQPSSLRYTQRRSIPRKWIERLSDTPKLMFPEGKAGIRGYQHFTDPTKMPFDILTFPSVNCTVPSFDKINPDLGKTLLGQAFTEDTGINGNKQKFKNVGGIEMEIRSTPSLDIDKKDIIEIYYINSSLVFAVIVGAFQVGETVTGSLSAATGIILSIIANVLVLTNITGEFIAGELISGATSFASASVLSSPTSLWHQITENVNPLPRGVHEYYFDEWFDTLLPNSIPGSPLSKNLPRAIWVNGYEDPATHKGASYSWTGGIGQILSFTGTSISLAAGTTWRSMGFTEDATGAVNIVVNGVAHNVPVPADLDTNTLNIASTAGIAIGDIATSKIEVDVLPIPFDVCRLNKGYMFYGSWKQRSAYQSNGFNREYNYAVTNFQALNNDLTFNAASVYTGTTQNTYRIVINTVDPNIETQQFIPTGNGINDGSFITSGYTLLDGITHKYRTLIVADVTLQMNTIVGVFGVGDIVKGNTSNATARIVKTYVTGATAIAGVVILSGEFVQGETITDLSNAGVTAILNTTLGWFYNNWIQAFKDDVNFNITTSATGNIVPIGGVGSFALIDGLRFIFGNISGHAVGDAFVLNINRGGADTFQWQKNGGTLSGSIPITGGYQAIADGLQIKFLNLTGHEVGDFWTITADPSVGVISGAPRAFANFYYTLPVRKPGEGYIYNLPSNFWTMDTFEEEMWINGSYGEWGFISTVLSADLQSEAVSYTPSKQTGSNKVLYPYLTGHMENDMVYITTNHTLDNISRQLMKEKPQIGYLSDPVKLDFDVSTFVGGRLTYTNKRLHITSPQNGLMHVYDNFKGYWQPPKQFPEMGITSIIPGGNDLLVHSNVRNQSYTMFTNSSGDAGGETVSEYTVEIRTPYAAPNGRWKSTFSSMSFTEGYIRGNPNMTHTVYEGINGCKGIFPHTVGPIPCVSPDRAPFGEGPFGSHSNGSDVGIPNDYFNEIYKAYSPILEYYFISLGLTVVAKTHSWSILSLGMNEMGSPSGNNPLVNRDNLVPNTTT